MLSFENDYSEGAHEAILEALAKTNKEQLSGYGEDIYCDRAKEKIRNACQCPAADVFFLVGGTQTNQVVIASLLQSYEGVLAAQTGHVNGHEAGAIEYSGHKVLALPCENGKLSAATVLAYLEDFYANDSHEHMVFPGMVYISYPTEYGTLYSKQELQELYAVCQRYHLPLYIDGARLGYGIYCDQADVTLADIAQYCDVFYIGGTKVGALCGEAVVFTKQNMPKHFMTIAKQHGALLAKGRLLGIQFDVLFTNDLYRRNSENALQRAKELREILVQKGYSFYMDSPTNQIFVVLPNEKMEQLKTKVKFCFWENLDASHTVVRFATSFATTKEAVEELGRLLEC